MTSEEQFEHKVRLIMSLDKAVGEAIKLDMSQAEINEILVFAKNRSGDSKWSGCIAEALSRALITEGPRQ